MAESKPRSEYDKKQQPVKKRRAAAKRKLVKLKQSK